MNTIVIYDDNTDVREWLMDDSQKIMFRIGEDRILVSYHRKDGTVLHTEIK